MPFKNVNTSQYFCHYCDKTFVVFKNLRNHVKEKHWNVNEKEIKRTIGDPKDLVKADLSDISCRLCGSNYSTIERFIEHLKGLHNKTFTNIPGLKNSHGIMGFDLSGGKMKCFVCSKEFRFFKNLSSHMNDHAIDFVCWICGKRLISEHRLHVHLTRHNVKPSAFECKYCPKVFKTVSSKNYHTYKWHTKKIIYKCSECGEIFSNYQKRLTHMVEMHKFKKPDYVCDYCKKHYANSSALAQHVRYVHLTDTLERHECEICDKSFRTSWLLSRHLLVHSGRKMYDCQYCDKKYAKKYTLNMHIKIHMNDKQHICRVCDMAFVQKGSLRVHVKKHHPEIDIKTI